MKKRNKYSTALTGAGFLLHEFREIVALKIEGLTDVEIKGRIIEENVLQYNKLTSLKRAVPYLIKRVNVLDQTLLQYVVNEDVQTAKLINLYGIMKVDQLFYEFMWEVVGKRLNHRELLETKDINVFFRHKMEQSEFLANIADSTETRLKNQYFRILFEAGILKDRRSGELCQPFLDDTLKDHLKKIGDDEFVVVLGEG